MKEHTPQAVTVLHLQHQQGVFLKQSHGSLTKGSENVMVQE